MKIEEILMKDRIEEVNPFAFARLEAKIATRNKQYLPKSFGHAVRLAFCAVIFMIGANVYLVFTQDNSTKQMAEKDLSYKKFMTDNYYDVLSDYYPEKLLFE